jgi:hypothetical protein
VSLQPTGSENGIGRGDKKALVYPFAQWASITGHKNDKLNHTVLFFSNKTSMIGLISDKINQLHDKSILQFASMQQPADFLCKEIEPEHPRLEVPFPLLA